MKSDTFKSQIIFYCFELVKPWVLAPHFMTVCMVVLQARASIKCFLNLQKVLDFLVFKKITVVMDEWAIYRWRDQSSMIIAI